MSERLAPRLFCLPLHRKVRLRFFDVETKASLTWFHIHNLASSTCSSWACGEIRLSHAETGVEKRCSSKNEPFPQALLWEIKNRHTHIKRTNRRFLWLIYYASADGLVEKKSLIRLWNSALLSSSLCCIHRCIGISNLPLINCRDSARLLNM